MYSKIVTRFYFYSIWTLVLIPQVIKSVNPVEESDDHLSRLKRSIEDGPSAEDTSSEEIAQALGVRSQTSQTKTRRSGVPSENKLDLETRIDTDTWDIDSDEETRRAAATSTTDESDEETRREAAESEENLNEETRKSASSPKDLLAGAAEKVKQKFWKKIMDDAIRKAVAPKPEEPVEKVRRTVVAVGASEKNSKNKKQKVAKSSEENSDNEARRNAGSNDNDNKDSNEETRKAAVDPSEKSDDETRRQADDSDSDSESNEDTRRAADSSETSSSDEARRSAGEAEGQGETTENTTADQEEETRIDATNLEGTSNPGTRRYQKNMNVNKNVNTNINSNVQIDPMGFPRDEEFRPHYRPDANLQRYLPGDVLEKLHACDVFRDNIIFVMGYLLRLPDGQLSAHEYLSLEMIYNAMKAKSVYMYNLLSTLNFLRGKSLSQQFAIVLRSLTQNLPSYMKSATAFWIKRISDRKINLDFILSQTPETNILAGISDQAFLIAQQIPQGEMRAYDEGSKITEELMGPIYVGIFHQLNQMKQNFSQSLFGSIVRDLPNVDSDPIFEEYVRFIAENFWNDKIPNWSKHIHDINSRNPYALVVSSVDELCTDNEVPLQIKKALLYIRHHFTESGRRIIRNTVKDTRTITANGLNIDMLFKAVVPFQTDDIEELKFRLRGYLLPHLNKDVTSILAGLNRFKYNTPTDLLLAFLARLQMRMPLHSDIQIIASALISNLLFHTTVQDVSPPENSPIAFWILIDSIVEPETNATILENIFSLQLSLLKNLKTWDKMQVELMPTRHECTYPRKCLLIILQKFKILLEKKSPLLPDNLGNTINELFDYVKRNLEEKNTPRPCYDSRIPLILEPASPPKTTSKKRKVTTSFPPVKVTSSSSTTISTKASTIPAEPVKITTQMPNIMTAQQKVTMSDIFTSRPVESSTASAEKISKDDTIRTVLKSKLYKGLLEITKSPEGTTLSKVKPKPSKINTKQSEIINSPKTTKPTLKTVYKSSIATKPLLGEHVTLKTTLKPSKMETKSSKLKKTPRTTTFEPTITTIKPPHRVTKRPKIITISVKTTLNPPRLKSLETVNEMTELPQTIVTAKSTEKPLEQIIKQNNSSSQLISQSTASKLTKPTAASLFEKLKISRKEKSKTSIVGSLKKLSLNSSSIDPAKNKLSMLPPNMNSRDCIIFDVKSDDFKVSPTIYTKTNVSGLPSTALTFPSMTELHADIHNDHNLFSDVNQECVKQFEIEILSELNQTIGMSYDLQLLGKNWKSNYPTRISAFMGLIEGALKHPKVMTNTKLCKAIEKYRDGLEFIGPYIFLPMLSRWKKFDGEMVWSSIDINNYDYSVLGNAPPKEAEKNIMTLPLINPSQWILPIKDEDGDPFVSLLPRLSFNNKYAKKLKPLADIFTQEKIKSIIGRAIDVSKLPNRGALFIYTLIQLEHHKTVQKNPELLNIIKMYLSLINRPAMYIKIPEDVITNEQYDVRGGWTVDTADLLELLPKPKSSADTKLYEIMRVFLSRPNLLAELKIPIPPMETTKGSFMGILIKKALTADEFIKDKTIKAALKYYEDKFDSKLRGRMNLGWIWSQKFIVSTEMHLGELIEKLIPYKELTRIDRQAYDDLVIYFTNHPHFLNTHSLPIAEYKTQGAFVRGFFEHLLEDSTLDNIVKQKVKKLLPCVKMTGEGAKSTPPLTRKAMPLVQPTWK